ncbi:MAG: methionyl-tRNA formyltransferase, partial [Bacteroidetes bacterium]|nr:methionyl-tRNA formyltransferase [Bacteroidota bacterium]
DFAVPSLLALHDAGHDIACVVTSPDKPRGRGRKVSPTPVKSAASERNLPVIEAGDLRDPSFIDALRELAADLFVVVAFRILPEEAFSIPPAGSFNLHASLLPRYRGAAPINHALMNGEKISGVTTFFLRKQVDTGNIILQQPVPLHENMTAGELHDLLADVGAVAVVRTVEMIEDGDVEALAQDDTLASPAPKIFRADCAIPWDDPARNVHDHIRGLSPHPAAWTRIHGREMKILESRVADEDSIGIPGMILETTPQVRVQCGNGSIELLKLKAEGSRAMTAEEYLRGHQLREREMFISPSGGNTPTS